MCSSSVFYLLLLRVVYLVIVAYCGLVCLLVWLRVFEFDVVGGLVGLLWWVCLVEGGLVGLFIRICCLLCFNDGSLSSVWCCLGDDGVLCWVWLL